MAFTRVCDFCGTSFVSRFRKARYCSRMCANRVTAGKRLTQTRLEMKAYFFANIPQGIETNPEVCWPWQGTIIESGYGLAHVNKDHIRAHRLSYELFVGLVPDGLNVLHDPILCNNRHCVNYHHLRCGTKRDNAQDSIIAGTKIHGEDHHNAKLSDDDIREMRRLYTIDNISYEKIAKSFHISFSTARMAIKAKKWKHINTDTYVPPNDRTNKLSDDDVRYIRQLHIEGMGYTAIAAHFHHKVTATQIYAICVGKSRSNVQ